MTGVPKTGTELAEIRTNRGLTLAQIAADTKIGVYYLQAIEKGELQRLPGGIYTRSYIRQYARAIEYNEHDLLLKLGALPLSEETAVSEPETFTGRLLQLLAPVLAGRIVRRPG
jgi:cytoskeletal protein RodZ